VDSLRIPVSERKRPITIYVNRRPCEAYEGEILLAALTAAGFKALKKSHVVGEPRGALCGMGVCFECQVVVDGHPNVRACMVEVRPGMEIEIHE